MGPTEGASLPQGLIDLSSIEDAVCLAFVDGATVDAPAELRALFPCLGTDQGPLDGLNPNSHAIAVALFMAPHAWIAERGPGARAGGRPRPRRG